MTPPFAPLPAPRAVLFDWDNTLIDSWAMIHHAMTATFNAMGQRPWTLEECRSNVRKSARDSFPELFGERWEEAFAAFYRCYETDHLSQLQPLPGAAEMLHALAAADDLLLGVVSNKNARLLRLEAAELGWDKYFQSLVGATDAERDKPAREVVDFALAGSGIATGPAVWFVGDTDIDVLCAQNCDCTAVLLRDTPPAAEEFKGLCLAAHVHNCADFTELALKSLENG